MKNILLLTTLLLATTGQGFDVAPEKGKEEIHLHDAFLQSFTSIVVSEIGDKTFFVAAIMSMRYVKSAVFVGAAGALVFMTAISCAFGLILPKLLPKFYTGVIAMILFLFFGFKLLYEWKYGEVNDDEKKEVELEMQNLHKKLVSSCKDFNHAEEDIEGQNKQQIEQEQGQEKIGGGKILVGNPNGQGVKTSPQIKQQLYNSKPKIKMSLSVPFKAVAWQAFVLTFLGEWGDRSQIATIALAAVFNPFMVFLGGAFGHILCTTIAILGGQILSDKISEKTVNLIGGITFVLFGIIQAFYLIGENNNSQEQFNSE